jgi:hypothetical protein
LLEDVAQDVHVYDRADGGGLGGVGHLARGAVIVVAQFLEVGADLVRHLEGVQGGIEGEEAAVVRRDVEPGVAFVNGAKQSAEVEPDGLRVVRVALLVGVLEGLAGQQPAAFAEGAEQNAVQQLLGAAQDFGRGDGGVLAAQAGQDPLADVGVIRTCWRMTSGWNRGLDSTAIKELLHQSRQATQCPV